MDIIRELKPKKYRYKDEINRGVEPVWGFIAQEVNDIYVFAAKEAFKDSLKGKYENLSKATKDAMVSILGEENHNVIETEKIDLSKTFMGFAWSLNN